MKKLTQLGYLLLLILFMNGCFPATTPIAPTDTSIPSTDTPVPTASPTQTPIPGEIVIPITSMKRTIPWLAGSYDENAQPATNFLAFNTIKPPFDNNLVRQAFAAAIDREAIAAIASRLYIKNVQPATTLIQPQILGINLYNEVGIPYDPARAKELLNEAGYEDVASFPKTTFYISASRGEAPGLNQQMAEAIEKMWEENLGIDVTVRSIGYISDLAAYFDSNPTGYEVYRMSFVLNSSEYMDPTAMIEAFSTNDERNYGLNYPHFANDEFEKLLIKARGTSDPATRQLLYIQAEKILCEEEAAVIPLFYFTLP